jgi:hypothetical protein
VYKFIAIAWFFIYFFLFPQNTEAQFLMDMLDTTTEMGKGFLSMYKKFDHLRIGGYLQPQYQVASAEGAPNFSGGDFAKFSDNRFMIRRGRIRLDYVRLNTQGKSQLQFVFQVDATERGVFVRDLWGRFWENKWQLFYFTTGIFARPFGYEVNLSSADRESPERGRMSQILMRTERDLGVMASFGAQKSKNFFRNVKIDAGLFNGQGLTGTTDFDSYKDFIGQVLIRPVNIGPHLSLSGGVSLFDGGLRQFSTSAYRLQSKGGNIYRFEPDSLTTSQGDKLPRQYYGVNGQMKWEHSWGNTEFRAEYWKGIQTATENTSETPGNPPIQTGLTFAPNYIRNFNGAFLLFLQNIYSTKHQLGLKLDWYDPNTKVKGDQIGQAGSNLNAADIRFTTLGGGYLFYVDPNLKITFWYERVWNETTQLPGFQSDVSDNILTIRVQFRF